MTQRTDKRPSCVAGLLILAAFILLGLFLFGCASGWTDTRNFLAPTFEYEHQGMNRDQKFRHLHAQMRRDGWTNWNLPFMDE